MRLFGRESRLIETIENKRMKKQIFFKRLSKSRSVRYNRGVPANIRAQKSFNTAYL